MQPNPTFSSMTQTFPPRPKKVKLKKLNKQRWSQQG